MPVVFPIRLAWKKVLDVYKRQDGVKVTVKGTSIINGNVELSKSTGNTEPMELNIEGGTCLLYTSRCV